MAAPDFEVEIEKTAHSQHGGYDLTIRQHRWGWSKSDLTREQLQQIEDAIHAFLNQPKPRAPLAKDVFGA